MKESYVKGLANHDGPESCGGARKSRRRSVDRGTCRQGIEPRKIAELGMPTLLGKGKATTNGPHWRGVGYPARSKTPGMHGSNLRENREILRPPKPARLGRIEKSKDVRR